MQLEIWLGYDSRAAIYNFGSVTKLGYFLTSRWHIFIKIFGDLFGALLKNVTMYINPAKATFWATFETFWLLFTPTSGHTGAFTVLITAPTLTFYLSLVVFASEAGQKICSCSISALCPVQAATLILLIFYWNKNLFGLLFELLRWPKELGYVAVVVTKLVERVMWNTSIQLQDIISPSS